MHLEVLGADEHLDKTSPGTALRIHQLQRSEAPDTARSHPWGSAGTFPQGWPTVASQSSPAPGFSCPQPHCAPTTPQTWQTQQRGERLQKQVQQRAGHGGAKSWRLPHVQLP